MDIRQYFDSEDDGEEEGEEETCLKEESLADPFLAVCPAVPPLPLPLPPGGADDDNDDAQEVLYPDGTSSPFFYHQTFVSALCDAEADPRCVSLLTDAENAVLDTFRLLNGPAQLSCPLPPHSQAPLLLSFYAHSRSV